MRGVHHYDFGMKTLFKETPHTEFWVHLLNVPEYRSIVETAISMLMQIPATYLCEVVFLVCVKSNLEREIQSHTSIH